MRICIALLTLLTISQVWAQPHLSPDKADFVVATDGTGDFTSVQAAIDAVPDFRKQRTTIFIKNGTYKEKLVLSACKTMVSFIGEDVQQTILTHDDYASKKNRFGEEMGTTGSSSFFLFGDDFIAENITFENSAGPVGQAVAVRVDGDRMIFRNCRFLGNQDTLYPHGRNSRQYYQHCHIEGTVDFIFGWSTAVFDDCDIVCKSKGYITAASTEAESPFGFVFKNCRIGGDLPADSVYLGRPWRDHARVVFMQCELGDLIRSEGWHNWGQPEREKTAFYAEYQNTGPGARPDARVPWSHQLTEEQARSYIFEKIFSGWNPNP